MVWNRLIVAVFMLIITACGSDVCFLGMGNCDQEIIHNQLTLSPSSSTVAPDEEVTFTVSGGQTPYSFTQLTVGGSMEEDDDGKSFVFTAPSVESYYCFRVTDSNQDEDIACVQVTSSR